MIPTLSMLEHLLRIYWSPIEHPDAEQDPYRETYRKSIAWLREQGLIEPCPPNGNDRPQLYQSTERGRAFVEHIRHLPLPVEKRTWEMPSSLPSKEGA